MYVKHLMQGPAHSNIAWSLVISQLSDLIGGSSYSWGCSPSLSWILLLMASHPSSAFWDAEMLVYLQVETLSLSLCEGKFTCIYLRGRKGIKPRLVPCDCSLLKNNFHSEWRTNRLLPLLGTQWSRHLFFPKSLLKSEYTGAMAEDCLIFQLDS